MDEQMCPRCKTTKYRNPSMVLMVNVCGHALCENCVEALFVRGTGACIQCGIALRRTNFRIQIFEDESVEKEVDIRKKILRDFNKMEGDFASLRDYNDYLEMVETIIFNLVNGIEIEETKKQIEDYKKEHYDLIRKNKSRLTKDNELIENLLEEEKQLNEKRKKQSFNEEQNEKNARKMKKDALIDELMCSNLPASHILASHRHAEEQKLLISLPSQKEQSVSLSVGSRGSTFLPLPKQEGCPYKHVQLVMETFGPAPVSLDELVEMGYLDHMRPCTDSELGGGFHVKIAVQRAVQEALCGIFHDFDMGSTTSPSFSSSSSDRQDVEMTLEADIP